MNVRSIALILFCGVFGALNSYSQGSGVRTEYRADEKSTKVETNMLYVGNTPDQFVGLQFTGSYKGEKLESPPTIQFLVYSFSKEPVFKKDKDRVVVAIVNGAETNVGTLTETVFKGETKNDVDTYFAVGGNPNVGLQVPLPQGASIRSGGSVTGLTMELLTLQLKPEQLIKLATAESIRFKIGSIIITPTPRQLDVIHTFVEKLTPKP